jgi:hypothetical protein
MAFTHKLSVLVLNVKWPPKYESVDISNSRPIWTKVDVYNHTMGKQK